MFIVKIIEETKPTGKLADAELHFTDGVLAGLKLIGFGVWARRGSDNLNVTFPARTYSLNGERRSISLLRPIAETGAQNGIKDAILEAYQASVARASEDFGEHAERALGVQ